ncbi:AraC family transcriptional regulator [Pseudomonas chlororaphis]|uniref:AraC family transcriptional regulator n=1 Tax=Pseudomonas chlororaphis TaxID=587753 RepID=UPI0007B36FB9|nr:helix-turn-helix transcriptional regulator [Pseudomonas chlororaphis]AZC65591.1 Transcriptional regulator, AraC family [Pseudomonas chlororaphis subsp. piscium]AZC71829.1 Transcriptional regulator, AraC family [Pseudomonas chlororaphis subsp. piscium]AZC91698.1 Transcriptional regulator, AraC family [Pseudomonas chlororaphis subsp. piscium]KZO47292.1 AraC family transcriptional regulator [Pseudomonas chlororaphis subsp. piscium]MBP5066569.1 helix-turn-helix transcriptional regulator [Pseudo
MLISHFQHGPISAYPRDYLDGAHQELHRHREAQLLYAVRGTMRVVTDQGAWVLPPTRAVWIPPLVEHEIFMAGDVHMRSLFIAPELSPPSLQQCCVLAVTPLLRELILRAVQGREHAENPLIQQLMLEEVARLENLPLHIPMPHDRRLQAICQALLQTPDHANTLEDWAQQVGASSRTLARLFQQELRMSFNAWRQQLRLMEALPRLIAGESVQQVATALGYGSARAFSAMFCRLLGKHPREYLGALNQLKALGPIT